MKRGLSFEQLVAAIQRQLDPGAVVEHNQFLADRLGHSRQFDVVMRGSFAGHTILGVIECKDLKRKILPEHVEAFVTKCADINANLKLLVSRSGFTKTALEKSRHHGIQALSLLKATESDSGVTFGTKWIIDLYSWRHMHITPLYADGASPVLGCRADHILYEGGRVLDWFGNYLLEHHEVEHKLGWVVGIKCEFGTPRLHHLEGQPRLLTGITFAAERICQRKSRIVPWLGRGFFDWHTGKPMLAPGSTASTVSVTMDFTAWADDPSGEIPSSGFIHLSFVAHMVQLEYVPAAPPLESL